MSGFITSEILNFLDHESNCDFVQVNWHKGPCDCGLFLMMAQLPPSDLEILKKHNPPLVNSFEEAMEARRKYEERKEAEKTKPNRPIARVVENGMSEAVPVEVLDAIAEAEAKKHD